MLKQLNPFGSDKGIVRSAGAEFADVDRIVAQRLLNTGVSGRRFMSESIVATVRSRGTYWQMGREIVERQQERRGGAPA